MVIKVDGLFDASLICLVVLDSQLVVIEMRLGRYGMATMTRCSRWRRRMHSVRGNVLDVLIVGLGLLNQLDCILAFVAVGLLAKNAVVVEVG